MVDKLAIVWITDNEEAALNMVLMYALKSNQKKWWKECRLITWGPSNKLVCSSEVVQEQIKQIQEAGVKVMACQRCAEQYGLVSQLTDMGIEVRLMGEPFTEYLKDESYRVVTI